MPRNVRADAEMPAALTCADVRAREWDFVEGALPLPERAAVQAHLDACETCRHSVTLCRSAESALRAGVAQIPPAGDLRTGFYARLAAEKPAPRRYGLPLALSALAAGLLAVALLRPTLPSPTGRPTSADRAVANRHIGTLSASAPHNAFATNTDADNDAYKEEALVPRSVPGLSEEKADRLFRDLGRRYPILVHRNVASAGAAGRRSSHSARMPSSRLKNQMSSADRTTSLVVPEMAAAKPTDQRYALNGMLEERSRRATPAADFDNNARNPAQTDRQTFNRSFSADAAKSRDAKEMQVLGKSELGDQKASARMRTEIAGLMPPPPAAGVSLAVTDDVRGFNSTTQITAGVEEQDDSITFHIAVGDSSN